MNIAHEAMLFARRVHAGQRRRYTGGPYVEHLAEVAGIVATVDQDHEAIATAWLHDCVEDQGVTEGEIRMHFGDRIALAVWFLSDTETGNRAQRKAASRERLAVAPSWVQTVKVADLISNTASIAEYDPKFARVYLAEKRLLLDRLVHADPRLLRMAREQVATGE